MNTECVSVIVPVYNTEKYLPDCIECVLRQTYQNWELLLIDDGSSDSCGVICDTYAGKEPRIRVIHKKNGGVSTARNTGLDAARGEYIVFLDSDDLIRDDYLETLLNRICEEKADIVCCSLEEVQDGNIVGTSYRIEQAHTFQDRETALKNMMQGHYYYWIVCGKLFRRETLGQERFSEDIRWGEDTMFMVRMCAKDPVFALIPYSGYIYIRRMESATKGNSEWHIPRKRDALKEAECLLLVTAEMGAPIRQMAAQRLAGRLCSFAIATVAQETEDWKQHREYILQQFCVLAPYWSKITGKIRIRLKIYEKMPWLFVLYVQVLKMIGRRGL